ncbi:verprolin [Dendryphion nanum]|uniref:Verprolin n=1 Tax=Dendryphion nanum TaxID=256645 RepID=A0A9P9IKM9_9PLEO|nr:verprolin [Dendryphion nanum]
MAELLSSKAYNPVTALGNNHYTQPIESPLAPGHDITTTTVILADDDTPRYYFTPRYSPTSTYLPSAVSPRTSEDFDFPTPRAHFFDMTPRQNSFPQYQQDNRISRTDSEFDSLYDVTDDEAVVPLKCSASVKKNVHHNRYPSIVIPSPSTWPTIEKLRSAQATVPPTPPQVLSPSRQGLSLITSHLEVPVRSTTPSLDGSLTSEEMEQLSCPSTPDIERRQPKSYDDEDEWGPVQLDLQALETLQHLGQSDDYVHEQQTPQVIEATSEMQQVSQPFLSITIPSSRDQGCSALTTPMSALSIPSPGGFFSSLKSTARHTWSIPKTEESVPNTSTAESFYNLPWDSRRNTVPEQPTVYPQRHSSLTGSTLDGFDDALPTGRSQSFGEDIEIKEINPNKTIFQYNENYGVELQKLATVNLERTSHWLSEQDELQSALREIADLTSPSSATGDHSRGSSLDKTIKKSVTFAEEPKQSPVEAEEPKQITTYIQGFEYIRNLSHKHDPYVHRQTRAEAMHVQRKCMPQAHKDQLLGKFELANPVRPAPPRPVSDFYMNDPTALKERIARAQTERQALDQMMPPTWVLQAQKQLNGGKLLSKAAARVVSRTRDPRILDVGGVATNDWAWQVACDYPYSTVTTVFTAGGNLTSNVNGPNNHKQMTVPNLWTLPFPSAHFDVISARTLYELLKTDKPLGRSKDEYDLCLKECFRCLKPGGILDYSLIDSDVIHAGSNGQAMSVEFGFNLKTRGYDASPTKTFLPRLRKAGFGDVQRMWMVLPMGKTAANWRDVLPVGADNQQEKTIGPDGQVELSDAPVYGTTADAAMMTGVVGSWMWEKWMLKLQMEMGKEEERMLEGVVQVLEEGSQRGSGWRYLTGYARK